MVLPVLITGLLVTPVAAQPGRGVVARLPDVRDPIRLDTLGLPLGVGAAPAATFAALEQVHTEFGIVRTISDRARGEMGNLALPVRREFAGERVSRALDCGRGLGGEYADQYRLTVALLTWVTAVPGHPDSSLVHTALVGGGRVVDGTRAWPMQCNSLGHLEARLAKRVRDLVRGGTPTTPPTGGRD